MKKYSQFLLIIIASIMLFSCQEKENFKSDYTYGKISTALHPFLFNRGSYWVYENQDHSQTDSVAVNSIEIDTLELGPLGSSQGLYGEEQYFNINYSSSLYGEYDEQLIGDIISQGFIYGGFIYLSDKEVSEERFNAKIAEHYNTMVVNGLAYKNVIRMELKKDSYLGNDMNLYYVDSVGIIKKEIKADSTITETWNLLRYYSKLFEPSKGT